MQELAASLATHLRRGANAVERLVDRDPYHVAAYRGYGTPGRILVLGRVLEDEGLTAPDVRHGKTRNLLAMLKRLESDPLPGAHVRVSLPGGDHELVADDEGYVREWLDADLEAEDDSWGAVGLQLLHPSQQAGPPSVAPILLPPDSATYGVISDMDDTVLQSEVSSFLLAARMVLLENARTRLPFAGVAAFYRALREGTGEDSPRPRLSQAGDSVLRHHDAARRRAGIQRHDRRAGSAVRGAEDRSRRGDREPRIHPRWGRCERAALRRSCAWKAEERRSDTCGAVKQIGAVGLRCLGERRLEQLADDPERKLALELGPASTKDSHAARRRRCPRRVEQRSFADARRSLDDDQPAPPKASVGQRRFDPRELVAALEQRPRDRGHAHEPRAYSRCASNTIDQCSP